MYAKDPQIDDQENSKHVPPFCEANVPIIVDVHIVEKFGEAVVGDGHAGGTECCLKLILVQLPVAVPVDVVEKLE